MLTKISRAFNDPMNLSERVSFVGGSFLARRFSNILQLNETVMKICNQTKVEPSKGAKTLLCRHEYLTRNLISEEKFLLEDTLREYENANTKFSFDQYFWDSHYSPRYSVNKSFIKTVLEGGYETIILGSWTPNRFWQPSISTLEKLKKKNIRIISIWFDSCSDKFIGGIKDIIDLFDIHVLAENPLIDLGPEGEKLSSDQKNKFISPCWSFAQNFLNPKKNKTINTVFLGRTGSYRDYRRKYIDALMKNNIAGYFHTGDRNFQLDWGNYRNIMSSANICLNFSYSVDKHQLKGRAQQAFHAKSLLLETKNPQIEVFFRDGIDYVSFETEDDLIEKINYYLENPEQAEKIAKSCYQKVVTEYTPESLWNRILQS